MSWRDARRLRVAAWCAAAALGACGGRAPEPAGTGAGDPPPTAPLFSAAEEAAADAIEGEAIRAVVAEIAADRYEGRAPGSPGDALTQAYLAAQLEAAGFAPAGENGGWLQRVPLIGVTAAQPPSWRFGAASGALELAQNEDFIVASGVQQPSARIEDAELVFVGYGIEAPEYGWDDFKGAALDGKILVMLNNDPDWDPELFAGNERLYYGRWTYKYESAARQGAAGAIIVHTTPSAGYPWQVVQSSWSGTQFALPAGGTPQLQIAGWVTEQAAQRLAALGEHDLAALVERAKSRDFTPVPLGVRTSIELRNAVRETESANVLGVLRGRDASVAGELVVYSAHYDHLGVGEPAQGAPADTIYNGARDNASGVGMVLAIGKAFAALPEPPRRSIMLLFPAAEEQGLLGSRYFAEHPPVPAGRIAANVNYDSGNIWGATRDLTFIGLGKSSLDDIGRAVAEHQGRVLKGDQFPDRGSYYRSDQFNFAKIGVPAFYFNAGTEFDGRPPEWGVQALERYTERDYHQPSDELTDEWRFDGMVLDAQFGFLAGLLVANGAELPAWNPGDEFEAARKAALESAGQR